MFRISILFVFITFLSCKTSQSIVNQDEIQEVLFDTLTFSNAELDAYNEVDNDLPYNPAANRKYDILHTKLRVSFDWQNQWVNGEADITMTSIFYDQQVVDLDAKGMDILSVMSNGRNLKYEYDGMVLSIRLSDPLTKATETTLSIKYIAKPNSSEGYSAGAITSDKGLFFIDPMDIDPYKPSQIWTQGETENNSRWFPTFDKPNERCSQEIFITVKEKYTTLSNGILVSSTTNSDGTRTDYWKQDKPHAPYLFMLAVGEFAWVKDQWNQLPLHYIVEKEYEGSAQDIFDHTPEMLQFFSDKLQYPYPWDKYAQIITRDYVSGAMENTSAVIFGEFVQKHTRELIDNDNDYIVAHEMFHHWFGDLVTCESWANLTLNEGFANYSEYLWAEHKHGRMKADHHRLNEMEGYLQSGALHPLIHYRYGNKEDMFDAHSYNKGGMVLHMLRDYVGDEAFFAALNKYLVDNEYSAVEVDELRMAFEDTTGEDLNWFFDQWYLRDGHPIINVSYLHKVNTSELVITTYQAGKHNFNMPFDVAIYDQSGSKTLHRVWAKNERDTFVIQNIVNPSAYVFDGNNTALAIITEDNKSDQQYLNQFKYSDLFLDKFQAFNAIGVDSPLKPEIVQLAIEEEYFLFKEMAIEYLLDAQDAKTVSSEKIALLATQDEHSQVRLMALTYLSEMPDYDLEPVLTDIMANEQAYPVIGYGLAYLSTVDYPVAEKYAKLLMDEKTSMLDEGLAVVFARSEKDVYRDWYEKKIAKTDMFQVLPVYLGYTAYLLNFEPNKINSLISELRDKGLDANNSTYQRYFATMIISQMRELLSSKGNKSLSDKAAEAIKYIKSKEKDTMLQGWYLQM